jgi:hypothetical protein
LPSWWITTVGRSDSDPRPGLWRSCHSVATLGSMGLYEPSAALVKTPGIKGIPDSTDLLRISPYGGSVFRKPTLYPLSYAGGVALTCENTGRRAKLVVHFP